MSKQPAAATTRRTGSSNPYEQGVADYKKNQRSSNPYPPFGGQWALYNKGYNSCWHPDVKGAA